MDDASDSARAPRRYREDPELGGWFYGDLRIQAELETHKFVGDWATENLSPGSRILDIAAGQGALAQYLKDKGFMVSCTSWDLRCRVATPQYELDLDQPFSVEDVGGTPFPLVCCIEIIEHLENPAKFLRDCRSLVADDGHLILTTPNVESVAARLQWLVRGEPLVFSKEEVRKNRHISMPWRSQLEFLIELAGFEIVDHPTLPSRGRRGRRGNWIRRSLKQLIYLGVRTFAQGNMRGNTLVYVLRPVGEPQHVKAGQVY